MYIAEMKIKFTFEFDFDVGALLKGSERFSEICCAVILWSMKKAPVSTERG